MHAIETISPHDLPDNNYGYAEIPGLAIKRLEPTQEDAEALFALVTENFEYLKGTWFPEDADPPRSAEAIEGNLENIQKVGAMMPFGVWRNGTLAGRIDISFKDRLRAPVKPDEATYAEVGFFVGKAFAGQGITTQAVRDVVDQVHKNLGISIFTAEVSKQNPYRADSENVLKKVGFLPSSPQPVAANDVHDQLYNHFELDLESTNELPVAV